MTDGGVALSVQYEDGDETLDAERLLLSIGRKPNTRGLGLQQAGVALAPNGGIWVDERMRTIRPGIYAAGDVTGRDQFVRSEEHTSELQSLMSIAYVVFCLNNKQYIF